MSTHFSAASDTVSAALRTKRIGVPVSVRIVDHAADGGPIEPRLAGALEAASRWLDADVRRLAALGDLASGQVSVLIELMEGQTALVSVGSCGSLPPLLEITVVGNCGVLSWEPGPETVAEPEAPAKTLSPAARQLLDAVRQSLRSRSPVDVAGGPPPADAPTAGARQQVGGERARDTERRPIRTKPPYGVLLVAGAHTHQENYADDFAADPRCRLIGVTDAPGVSPRRQALNEELAKRLGIPLLPDLDHALAREDVHVVSVCAEPERRAGIMVRCARAGKHLYLDKPMTASVEEAIAVAAAVREAGVVSQMFSQVHWPASARVRQIVDSGALGDLRALHCDLTFAKGPAGTVPIDKPRAEQPKPHRFELVDSKREMYTVGVYSLVLLHWLLGQRVRRVFAVTANYFFAEHRRNDMEDFAVALMELDDGITATLACGRCGWRSHPMGGLNRTCLVGTKGAASVDAYRPRLEVWADENPWLPPKLHPQDPMGFWKSTFEEIEAAPKQAWITPPGEGRSDAACFLDCIEQGRQSDVSADVGAGVIKVLMAAYESAATGRFVSPAT